MLLPCCNAAMLRCGMPRRHDHHKVERALLQLEDLSHHLNNSVPQDLHNIVVRPCRCNAAMLRCRNAALGVVACGRGAQCVCTPALGHEEAPR